MRNFKELKIWQKGFEIAADIYKIVGSHFLLRKSLPFSLS